MKRNDSFENGVFIQGNVWGSTGKVDKYTPYEVMLVFREGLEGLMVYLAKASNTLNNL